MSFQDMLDMGQILDILEGLALRMDEYIRKGFPLTECFLVSLYSTHVIERSLS